MFRNTALFAGLIAVLITSTTSFAQTALSVGNVLGYPGAILSVPINLRQPAGSTVAAQFDVAFNASKVTAGVPLGTTQLAKHIVKSREISPGVRRTLVYSLR